MGMSTGGSSSYNSEINVTPLVDVMLVLLIIFMVITPLLSEGVKVALPESEYGKEDEDITKDDSVVVSVAGVGIVYLGKEPISKDSLGEKLKEKMAKAARDRTSQVVYVRAEKTVPVGEVYDVIKAAQDANVPNLGLVTEKRK